MSEEQARRVGPNESIFRQVNEQIERLNSGFGYELPTMAAICECASGDCTERLEIPVAEYEKVRADARRYLVVPGHALPEFEATVEHRDGYDVVEKREGVPAEVAERTDPRT
ncbi:MAG TPA: hypothetical protein VFV91_06270 [Gaiellaceae bacterium]|nr:hypothetical protein [Gaiellaceae bacterium]